MIFRPTSRVLIVSIDPGLLPQIAQWINRTNLRMEYKDAFDTKEMLLKIEGESLPEEAEISRILPGGHYLAGEFYEDENHQLQLRAKG